MFGTFFADLIISDLYTQGIFLNFRILGLYGFTFVDFGIDFKVFDTTGEESKPCLVSNITNDS